MAPPAPTPRPGKRLLGRSRFSDPDRWRRARGRCTLPSAGPGVLFSVGQVSNLSAHSGQVGNLSYGNGNPSFACTPGRPGPWKPPRARPAGNRFRGAERVAESLTDDVRGRYGAVAGSGLSGDHAGVRAVAEAFGYSPEE